MALVSVARRNRSMVRFSSLWWNLTDVAGLLQIWVSAMNGILAISPVVVGNSDEREMVGSSGNWSCL